MHAFAKRAIALFAEASGIPEYDIPQSPTLHDASHAIAAYFQGFVYSDRLLALKYADECAGRGFKGECEYVYDAAYHGYHTS